MTDQLEAAVAQALDALPDRHRAVLEASAYAATRTAVAANGARRPGTVDPAALGRLEAFAARLPADPPAGAS